MMISAAVTCLLLAVASSAATDRLAERSTLDTTTITDATATAATSIAAS
jgi:hypothetical protein